MKIFFNYCFLYVYVKIEYMNNDIKFILVNNIFLIYNAIVNNSVFRIKNTF